jgi:hypothetical protein
MTRAENAVSSAKKEKRFFMAQSNSRRLAQFNQKNRW